MDQTTLTEQILRYWKETDAFQQSIESRSTDLPFSFFDGPPFTSGDPHYGHLLQSVVKDMVPRWMTMRGYRVARKRGWDCHGIPAENYVNKQLGITSKKQVEEEVGIKNYIEACRSMVNEVNDNWQWTVDHMGRWVDMDNAYFTMNNDYMESVINVFADLYHRNLIYKGFKVLGYSWALGTPLSNHEINEGYEMRQDPAVTIKLPMYGEGSQTYETSEQGAIQCVIGIIRSGEKILQVYDIKHGVWFLPGGKVDKGESPETAVKREIAEELGLTVTASTYAGKITVPHGGELYELVYFELETSGTPQNLEPEKQGAVAWVSKIAADNDLGYAMKAGDLIIDDVEQINHDFKDFLVAHDKLYALPGIDTATVSLLAWTTTPWTLPSNMFAAVNNDVRYVMVYDHALQESFVLAASLVGNYYTAQDQYTELFVMKGEKLVGCAYTPPFSYYYDDESISDTYKQTVHHVLHADFVTTDAGTGIAHQAPAFGEDDYNLVASILPKELAQDWLFDPINDYGEFTDKVPQRSGVNVIEANKPIIKQLKDRGVIVKHETINHSYPHCPRTGTPLIYKAIESWFVKEHELKQKTIPAAENILFVPETVKKRFVNGLESAPDWNISRTRFWGCPLPVWEHPNNPDERVVVGSIQEIYELNKEKGQIIQHVDGDQVTYTYADSGKPVDLHRPYIDEIVLVHPETGNELYRIPEVLDCWFESGSMPYGQNHLMKRDIDAGVQPAADFIAEGLDQTRGWFRALHVIGNAYIDKPVYKNVVVTGMILAEDGKKMSKRLKNYPDPSHLLNQYGADALRLYMLSSPVVRGEPLRFSEQGVEQMLKDFVIPLNNVWNFLSTYAAVDGWKDAGTRLHFMRHAHCPNTEENQRNHDTPLTTDGLEQLETRTFIEQVIRIQPDIIISSDHRRAIQTAQGVQNVMKNHGGKHIEIIETSMLALGMNQDTVGSILDSLLQEHAGKSILIVSHKKRFRYVWKHLTAYAGDVHTDVMREKLYIDNCEVVPLPLKPLTNELDQWIYAELHAMMVQLNDMMEAYTIEPATKVLLGFIDKLTNWYVRRSRRRFWAGGMEQDKLHAYQTLSTVLQTYVQCAAPYVPFITEHIWQAMGKSGSVHTSYRPIASTLRVDKTLIDEITTVRKIIKGALYIRAKNQIKVKQPLQSLQFRV